MIAIPIVAIEKRDAKIALAVALGGTVYEDSAGCLFAVFAERPANQHGGFEIVTVPPGWKEIDRQAA